MKPNIHYVSVACFHHADNSTIHSVMEIMISVTSL